MVLDHKFLAARFELLRCAVLLHQGKRFLVFNGTPFAEIIVTANDEVEPIDSYT